MSSSPRNAEAASGYNAAKDRDSRDGRRQFRGLCRRISPLISFFLKRPTKANLALGRIIKRHLTRGTRPSGSANTPGKAWSVSEFAASLGVSDHVAGYWLSGKVLPEDITSIERELLGENSTYASWREELQTAYRRARDEYIGDCADAMAESESTSITPKRPFSIRRGLAQLLLHVLGPEAYRGARQTRRMHLGTLAILLGVIADLCTLAQPLALKGLAFKGFDLSLVAVLLLSLPFVFRSSHRKIFAVPLKAACFLTVSFGLMTTFQWCVAGTIDASVSGALYRDILIRIDARLQKKEKDDGQFRTEIYARLDADHQLLADISRRLAAQIPPQSAPLEEKRISSAVAGIAKGASEGDELQKQALDRLKANDRKGAAELLQQDADAKWARLDKDRKDAVDAYRTLGTIVASTDPARALHAFETAIRYQPDDVDSLIGLGILHTMRGRPIEANKYLEKALALLPKSTGRSLELFWIRGALATNLILQINLPDALSSLYELRATISPTGPSDNADVDQQTKLYLINLLIGLTRHTMGDLDGALQHYREGVAVIQRLNQMDSGTSWRQAAEVEFHNKMGDILIHQGDPAGALGELNEGAKRISLALKDDPGNTQFLTTLASTYSGISRVLFIQREFSEALDYSNRYLGILQKLTKIDPANPMYQELLAASYDGKGNVLMALGQRSEALKCFQLALEISTRIVRENPNNSVWQEYIAISDNGVGKVLETQTQPDLEEALRRYREAASIMEKLVHAAPDALIWQRRLGDSYRNVGDVLKALGGRENMEGALASYRGDLAVRQRLLAAHPGDTELQYDVADSSIDVGQLLISQGQYSDALPFFRACLDTVMEALRSKTGDTVALTKEAACDDGIGQATFNDPSEASNSYRNAIAILERVSGSDIEDLSNLSLVHHHLAELLMRTTITSGTHADALKALRAVIGIQDRIAKLAPTDRDTTHERWWALSNMGNVLVADGKLTQALEAYRSGLAIAGHLAESDPGNWLPSLAASYADIGKALKSQGNASGAIDSYRNGLRVLQRLDKDYPGTWDSKLVLENFNIAAVFIQQKSWRSALESLRAAVAISQRHADSASPDYISWRTVSARLMTNIGEILRELRSPEALDYLKGGVFLLENVVHVSSDDAGLQIELGKNVVMLAEVLERERNPTEALHNCEKCLAIFRRLAEAAGPDDAIAQHNLGICELRIADLLRANGRIAEAERSYQSSLGIFSRLTETDSTNVPTQRILLRLHRQLAILGDDPPAHWALVTTLSEKLQSESKLTAEESAWRREAKEKGLSKR
jgi:tetratricopeptide (TPR) repeat protein